MALGLTLPDFWDTSYDAPVTGETVLSDIATQRQDAGFNSDSWAAVWNEIGKPLLSYAVAKDAARSGMTATAQPGMAYQQPVVYQQPSGQPGVNTGTLLIVGAVVVAALLVTR